MSSDEDLLPSEIEYRVEETWLGTWRSYRYPDGQLFSEFTSHEDILGIPLIHFTRGKCPATGRRIVARGIIAVGRLAVGMVAIGHASAGVIALGQLAIGLGFGLGQAATGFFCVGQLALGVMLGVGQIVTGYVAVGQLAFGQYVLAQLGIGAHVWDTRGVSPIARRFFKSILFWRFL